MRRRTPDKQSDRSHNEQHSVIKTNDELVHLQVGGCLSRFDMTNHFQAQRRASQRIREWRRHFYQKEKRSHSADSASKVKRGIDSIDSKFFKVAEIQKSRNQNKSNKSNKSNSNTIHVSNSDSVPVTDLLFPKSPSLGQDYINESNLAVHNADLVSALIDSTLGLASAHTHAHSEFHSTSMIESKEIRVQQDVTRSPSAIATYSPTKLYIGDMLCIRVINGWGFESQNSADTNIYCIFDWNRLGKALTHSVRYCKNVVFNSNLRFKSPTSAGATLSEALIKSPPLVVTLCTRSLGDNSVTSLGTCILQEQDMAQGSVCVNFMNATGKIVGFIKVEVNLL